jgi:hypothetical protein
MGTLGSAARDRYTHLIVSTVVHHSMSQWWSPKGRNWEFGSNKPELLALVPLTILLTKSNIDKAVELETILHDADLTLSVKALCHSGSRILCVCSHVTTAIDRYQVAGEYPFATVRA